MNTPEDIVKRLNNIERAVWKEDRGDKGVFIVFANVNTYTRNVHLIAIGQGTAESGAQAVLEFGNRLTKFMDDHPEVTLTLLDDSVFDIIYSSLTGE